MQDNIFVLMRCISLLSDLGLQDVSVASAKAILMQYNPGLSILDITHLTGTFHLQQAAYLLVSSYKSFPEKTCHIALMDVFSEKNPTLVLCLQDDHYFLAPDNGLLALAFPQTEQVWRAGSLQEDNSFRDWVHQCGRLVQMLQQKDAAELGLESYTMKNAPIGLQPRMDAHSVEAHVIHIDRFENVVVNITRKQFEEVGKGRAFNIRFMRDEQISVISNHYSDVREGEKLCRFNAAGYLEIAINRGKAASLFGLSLYAGQQIIYNTVKINFE